MDSLTQVVLGSAVGYSILGSKIGRKAALWGGIIATLPDLDVFIPFEDAVESFTYHRSFSHSLFIHLLISPLLVWLLLKIHIGTQNYKQRWFWLVFLCLSTHAILDSLTVYGTQLLWPFSEYPFALSSIFIVDPLYTLPLIVSFIIILLPNISAATTYKVNTITLLITSLYLSFSLILKVSIDSKVKTALSKHHIDATHYISTPAPLTTLLWRIVVMSDHKYYEIYTSVFDAPDEITIYSYNTKPSLLNNINNEWGVKRLKWFTKGFYSVKEDNKDIILSDLRMGSQCNYVFNFIVATKKDKQIYVSDYKKISQRSSLSKTQELWRRIWEPSVSLAPKIKDKNGCAD